MSTERKMCKDGLCRDAQLQLHVACRASAVRTHCGSDSVIAISNRTVTTFETYTPKF